jgi:hypothetical protein
MNHNITASIVLYKNKPSVLLNAINSFLRTRQLSIKLYLIDNSPTDELKQITQDSRCEYIFCGKNLGFGKAHNIALKLAQKESLYHIVLNPDVYFDPQLLNDIYSFMENSNDVGQLMPKVLYPNGELQYSGKLLPSPFDLLGRRLLTWMPAFKKRNDIYELRHADPDKMLNVPQHLGCFMFFRVDVFRKSGLFDENIFMYTEDIDITRRVNKFFKTLYCPQFTIYHHYEKGSRKSMRLFFYHIRSAIIYFNKWGWLFDSERRSINNFLIKAYLIKS